MAVVKPTRASLLFAKDDTKAATAAPPPNDWLKQLLNDTIEAGQPLWVPEKKHFRASGAGTKCVRALTFQCAGHRVPHKAKTRRLFKVGDAIEDEVVGTMQLAGIVEETQAPIEYEDPPVKGKADVIARRPSDAKLLVGEVKSINSNQFKRLPREHDVILASASPLFAIKPGYVEQWNTYACAPDRDFDEGFVLFEAKDDSDEKVYWLRRDDELMGAALDRMRIASRYVQDEPQRVAPIPDDRNPFKGDPVCAECPHRYLCRLVPEEGATVGRVKELDAEVRG